VQEPRIIHLTRLIDQKVSFLKIKANEFKNNNDIDAYNFADRFANNLQKYTKEFLEDGNEIQFTKRIISAITTFRSILEQQPWWKDLLNNFILTN
jgi:hypothetical protein